MKLLPLRSLHALTLGLLIFSVTDAEAATPPSSCAPSASAFKLPLDWKLPPSMKTLRVANDPSGAAPVVSESPASATSPSPVGTEVCNDLQDNDADGMIDCADAECYSASHCKAGSGNERSNAECSDWVDNDGDGVTDCDDADCLATGISVCEGSWKEPLAPSSDGLTQDRDPENLPELSGGATVEDLIGKGNDKDGERNDELCSDGQDNDADGMTDCADFGCRFDPGVTICRGNPGMRFSVVASVAQTYEWTQDAEGVETTAWDTRFTKLQLRSFGPLPFIQDSFYLVSLRTEKTPRLTFAMFQIPLKHGHFINLNSGGGGLSSALIISDAKQLLLDPAYYVYKAFEQGNGAAVEASGPVMGPLRYRAFVAGGSGLFSGNVGGRYFKDDLTNYTWAVGGQLGMNLIGYYSRFDTPYLYTRVPTTLGVLVGAKYDQRANERYPAANFTVAFRSGRIVAGFESFVKQELDFKSFQYAYNLQAGYLLVPKKLMLAADYGAFVAQPFQDPTGAEEADLGKPQDEWQLRAALHWYFWRNIGVLSARYQLRWLENKDIELPGTTTAEGRLEAQYRF